MVPCGVHLTFKWRVSLISKGLNEIGFSFWGDFFFGERRNLLCEKKPSEGEAIFLKKEKAGRGYKEISSIFGWLV